MSHRSHKNHVSMNMMLLSLIDHPTAIIIPTITLIITLIAIVIVVPAHRRSAIAIIKKNLNHVLNVLSVLAVLSALAILILPIKNHQKRNMVTRG